MTRALISVKAMYRFGSGHMATVNQILRFPITIPSLLARIWRLALDHNLTIKVFQFDLAKGKKFALSALKGMGGIYILHNKTTGLFYLGSALRYFDAKGRLNDYFSPSRVDQSVRRESTKVSYDLAVMIQKYGIGDFTLIVIPVFSITSEAALKALEQLWMLLLPTLNRSLSATSNNQLPMDEAKRQEMSTLVYVHEVVNGVLVVTKVYGRKLLSASGVVGYNNVIHNITYNALLGLLHSGAAWKGQFVFSYTLLTLAEVQKRLTPVIKTDTVKGVWVYDWNTRKFICHEKSIIDCHDKYNISRTHFKHVRKYGICYNGKLFSNHKLH